MCIDETGDKKKEKFTDYTARQYIGNLGKTENAIVSINHPVWLLPGERVHYNRWRASPATLAIAV